MPLIKADIDGMGEISSALLKEARRIEDASSDLQRVINRLEISLGHNRSVSSALLETKKDLNREKEFFSSAASFVKEAKNAFEAVNRELNSEVGALGRKTSAFNAKMDNFGTKASPETIYKLMTMDKIFGLKPLSHLTIGASLRDIRKFKYNMECLEAFSSEEGSKIYSYLKEHDAENLFGDYNYLFQFLNDMTVVDGFLHGITHVPDILLTFVKENPGVLLGGAVGLGFTAAALSSADEIAEAYLTDPGTCKAYLRQVVDSMCGTSYPGNVGSDAGVMQEVASFLANEAGWPMGVTVDTVNFLTGENGQMGKLLADYAGNIKALEAVVDSCPSGSLLESTARELLEEYKNKNNALLGECIEEFGKTGAVTIVEELIGSKFGSIDAALQLTLGNTPNVEGLENVFCSTYMRNDAVRAFKEAAREIEDGVFTKEDLDNYHSTFKLAKTLTIKQYEGMRDVYILRDKEKAMFLQNEIFRLQKMSNTDFLEASRF